MGTGKAWLPLPICRADLANEIPSLQRQICSLDVALCVCVSFSRRLLIHALAEYHISASERSDSSHDFPFLAKKNPAIFYFWKVFYFRQKKNRYFSFLKNCTHNFYV